MTTRRLFALPLGLLSATLATLAIGGCPNFPGNSNPPGQQSGGRLVPFGSSGEMLGYFKQQALARSGSSGFSRDFLALGGEGAPTAGGVDNAQDDAGGDFTGTNLQEADVDESDVVKTDGTTIFVGSGTKVHMVRASDAARLATIELPHEVDSLFLAGSRLFALQRGYDQSSGGGGMEIMLIWPPYYPESRMHLAEIDVSDPAAPQVVRTVELDGALATARIVGEHMLLVLTIAPPLPQPLTTRSAGAIELDDVLPKITVDGDSRPISDWNDWLRPESPNGYYMTSIVTLPLADIGQVTSSVGVIADAGTVYVSPRAIYLADTDYGMNAVQRESTTIHRLTIAEDGTVIYADSGEVPGRPLNQFSLGEHNGDLRIATHVQPEVVLGRPFQGLPGVVDGGDQAVSSDGSTVAAEVAASEPTNAVFVLRPGDDGLEVIGQLTGLAPGERIYAARFLGDRGFLVTFRQVDPLFALDLSDPTNPVNAGELKIPGFSDYLHPVGDSHLIGIGRSTVEMPWGGVGLGGVQLSLFDVSDLGNPKLVQQRELGGPGSVSDVSQSHKAFTYLASTGVLALPVTLYPNSVPGDMSWMPTFEGVSLFQVDLATGFESLGQVPVASDPIFYRMWRRALIVGEGVFAIAPDGVTRALLSDLSQRTSVTLP